MNKYKIKEKFINKFLIYNYKNILNTSNIWISVKERLPNEKEYLSFRKDGTNYYKRLTIAFQTDTIMYDIGYYDGYKWFNEYGRKIEDVIAWKPFILYEKDGD